MQIHDFLQNHCPSSNQNKSYKMSQTIFEKITLYDNKNQKVSGIFPRALAFLAKIILRTRVKILKACFAQGTNRFQL